MRCWALLLSPLLLACFNAAAIDTDEGFTDLPDPNGCSNPTGAALLQTRSQGTITSPMYEIVDAEKVVTTSRGIPVDLSWTTNAGESYNQCPDSQFNVDQEGTYSGLVMSHGLRIAKGQCPSDPDVPRSTQDLVCADSSGCHMWCAPVWNSYRDTLDWSVMAKECVNWNGRPKPADPTCYKASRVYTWGRTIVPQDAVNMKLVFAILGEVCEKYCTGLQVTVYDVQDWSRTFRYCFNHKPLEVNSNEFTEMSHCDSVEDIPLGVWRERHFHHSANFTSKFDYDPQQLALEFAVYSEFSASEVLVRSLHFDFLPSDPAKVLAAADADEKALVKLNNTQPPSSEADKLHCGVIAQCPEGTRCCRGQKTQTCCSASFQCCGDVCCPSYFTCQKDGDAPPSCVAPATPKPPVRPELCSL